MAIRTANSRLAVLPIKVRTNRKNTLPKTKKKKNTYTKKHICKFQLLNFIKKFAPAPSKLHITQSATNSFSFCLLIINFQ